VANKSHAGSTRNKSTARPTAARGKHEEGANITSRLI